MRIASLLCFLLVLPACDTLGSDSKNLATDPSEFIDIRLLSEDPEALVGTWGWVQSTYYETLSGEPWIETPASTGRTEVWTFLADGTARLTIDGEVVRETAYEVRRRTYSNDTQDERASLQFASGGYGFDFGTDDDLLVLDNTPLDGPQSVYHRR